MKKDKGYKQTKIGLIPEDWEIKQLGEISNISSGGTPSRGVSSYWNGNIPWVTTSQIDFNIINQANEFITEEGLKNSAAKICKAGTLLMAMYGQGKTRGKVALLGFDATTNQACAIISLENKIFNEYIFYNLSGRYEEIRNLSNTGNQENLNSNIIKSIPIPLPPLPEQKKIAVILSTWDEAIEKLESLVALKEKRKKGLMQSLLTGKKRLKGFNANWIEYYLGDLFNERIEIGFNNLPLVSVTRDRGIIFRNLEDQKDTSSEDKSKYLHICPGDIGYNTMRMWQGVSGLSEIEGIVSPAYTILKPQKNVHGLFFQYLFKFPSMINYFYRHSQGLVSDTLNLKYSNFRKIKAFIPPLPEQKHIAEVLSTADNEMNLHKEEIEKIKLQKKGLMQKLLTGQVRVNG